MPFLVEILNPLSPALSMYRRLTAGWPEGKLGQVTRIANVKLVAVFSSQRSVSPIARPDLSWAHAKGRINWLVSEASAGARIGA